MDRYASIGTGWPLLVDERDISTDLPGSEEAFEMSRPEETLTLADSMCPSGASKLSPFGSVVLMACLFGRNLVHLHRPDADDRDFDLNGEFWKRHRGLDNVLLNTSLCLPNNLKLPAGLNDPNVVFANMNIHTSTICLHQAAIFKADKNKLPASVGAESKVRCITAANEIASIMKMVSHMDLSSVSRSLTPALEFRSLISCVDESLFVLLSLCCRPSIRPIPQEPPGRWADSRLVTLPARRNGRLEEEELVDRIILGPARRRFRGIGYENTEAQVGVPAQRRNRKYHSLTTTYECNGPIF